jgi:hypothetical protein
MMPPEMNHDVEVFGITMVVSKVTPICKFIAELESDLLYVLHMLP